MKTTLNKNTEHISVNVRSILLDGIFLSVFGRNYYISFERLPWFKNAKVPDIIKASLISDYAIRWETLDIDLEIENLMFSRKISACSEKNYHKALQYDAKLIK